MHQQVNKSLSSAGVHEGIPHCLKLYCYVLPL